MSNFYAGRYTIINKVAEALDADLEINLRPEQVLLPKSVLSRIIGNQYFGQV